MFFTTFFAHYWRYDTTRKCSLGVLQSSFAAVGPSRTKFYKPNRIRNNGRACSKNHSEYMRLINSNLKPKHHFMIHYLNLIRQIGLLKNVYVMKHEMYHRELKRYIHQTYNRRNLPKSVLIKESFQFAARLVEGGGYRKSPFENGHHHKKETKPDKQSFF